MSLFLFMYFCRVTFLYQRISITFWNNDFTYQCLNTFRFTVTPCDTRFSDSTNRFNNRCRVAVRNDSGKYDVARVGFLNNVICFVWVKVWHIDSGIFIIVIGCRWEDMYDGIRLGFYVCECVRYLCIYICMNI